MPTEGLHGAEVHTTMQNQLWVKHKHFPLTDVSLYFTDIPICHIQEL